MTPKVGDKFKITKSNFFGDEHTEGGIVTYIGTSCGHGLGKFLAKSGLKLTFAYEGNKDYPCRVVPVTVSTKNPIEYLKSAHANGLMVSPETMLSECFGITKTERVVTEWSEVKRDIKAGDRVRIVGPASYVDQSKYMGEIKAVMAVDPYDKEATYNIGPFAYGISYWFPASSVELV